MLEQCLGSTLNWTEAGPGLGPKFGLVWAVQDPFLEERAGGQPTLAALTTALALVVIVKTASVSSVCFHC